MASTMGRRIASKRVGEGWTQEQLAEKAGLSAKYVSRVEQDNANLSARVLADLARALGETMDYIYFGNGAM